MVFCTEIYAFRTRTRFLRSTTRVEAEYLDVQSDSWLGSLENSWLGMAKRKTKPERLKGWQAIADFLGQVSRFPSPTLVEIRDASQPRRSARACLPGELNRWLGRESAGEPVQIPTEDADLSADLKRGLSYGQKHGRAQKTA